MKAITLLLDGLGDRSYEALNWKTPLQYANTPNLDKIASQSQCGLMIPKQLGCALGTDLAHLLLFGYDLNDYPGRGMIDAIGEDLTLSDDTLVLRASFADVTKGDGYFLNSRFTQALSNEEVMTLCQALTIKIDGYSFQVLHSHDSHCFILINGEGLSDRISDSDPFYTNQYVMTVEAFESTDEKDAFTAKLVNSYLKKTYDILQEHPINKARQEKGLEVANMLLCKWAGKRKSVSPFNEQNGMSGLLLGQSKLLEGLSKYLSLEYKSYTTFEEAISYALATDSDYVHLHTKAPDTASHKKDPFEKVAAIESIDALIAPLMTFDGLLLVTADHSTPCSGEAIHSGESVPFMAKGLYIRRDDVSRFDEIACSQGSVMLSAKEFMYYIQNATDRGALYHLRAGKKWRNYKVRTVNRL